MRVNIVEVTHRNRTVTVIRALAEPDSATVQAASPAAGQAAGPTAGPASTAAHLPGQSIQVQVPHLPGQWLQVESSLAPNPDGQFEFHLPAHEDAGVLREVARVTRSGDQWELGASSGEMTFDPQTETLMVADGLGWAAMKSLLTGTFGGPTPISLHLFLGADSPGNLYDLQYVWQLAATSPWLHVHPVVRSLEDPWWLGAGPDSRPPAGLGIPQVGEVGEIVSRFGSWRHADVLVAGGVDQVQAIRTFMEAKGTPSELIQTHTVAQI